LVWICEEEPQIANYSPSFDNLTKDAFDALPLNTPNLPTLYFTTDADSLEFQIEFDEPKHGKFIHIKLLEPHTEENIDVETIAFVGYEGNFQSRRRFPHALQQLGLSFPQYLMERNAQVRRQISLSATVEGSSFLLL
jgi:hypothetical protein